MRVVLVRHAKSDYPVGVADHDRPLAPRGLRDAPAAGRWLDEHVTWAATPPTVLVSTATRAQQTWDGMSGSLGAAWAGAVMVDEPAVYEASARTLHELMREQAAETLVIVGHNPGLHDVVLQGRPSPVRDAAGLKFPTCAVAVLEGDKPGCWPLGDYEVAEFAVPRG